ncbi:uncharacterized protein LOC126906716 isoform X1 [Daktulosphaira vitifoliae]|uniref:uncharacterized protein LOC126906716 isoform X1 n=1 Tax=Daktulosphaira vitifoliae TaxID=58002 RepID=UPI0021A9C873|nr:uncharacterized protein LOC126906716 isoform X1 [Daktulosphaira vitifoliae]XP_050543431.1 uncharacterized protein LOC126906716 isoform X1 [Daktulosphaira vitifoliae]
MQTVLIVSCEKIKKRYDFNNSTLMKLYYFQPKVVLSNMCINSLYTINQEIPRIAQQYNESELQMIDSEWRMLRIINLNSFITNIKDVDEFWINLYNLECDGEFKFRNVANFVLKILSLPHSSVDCEQIFSQVNLIKTKIRNRLQVESLNGLLLSSEHIKSVSCENFTPTKSMLNLMNSKMYSYEEAKETVELENPYSNVVEFGNFTA